nr:hypothetical protein [uncultured Lichenicoccus sp.]
MTDQEQSFLALGADFGNETVPRNFREPQIESSTMARAAVKSRSPTGRKATDATTPKRRPGRPPGVKNKVKAVPAKAAKSGKAAATAKSAAPKRNKAELETHVIKLERTVLRLREQNKELKRVAASPAETAESPAPVSKPVRRRVKKEVELPVE